MTTTETTNYETNAPKTARVLSIDAWRDPEGGWRWNNWYSVGEIDRATLDGLNNNRAILRYLRDVAGCLTDYSKGRVGIEDDGYNLTVYQRSNGMPLYAIEYGPVYGI